jgi:hypothetical protein
MFISCAVVLFLGAVAGFCLIIRAMDSGVDSMCLGEFLFLPSLLYMAMDAWLPPHPQMLCCFYPLSFICQEARNPISYVFFLVLLMDAM